MDKQRPIGIFDSGVGGLSVLRILEKKLPEEDYIYFGDTARAPYGNRSQSEIRRFNLEIGRWLLSCDCKMLLVACHTSTVLGMDAIQEETEVPVIGMMEAVLTGAFATDGEDDSPIGFIATSSTVQSGAYQKAFAEKAPGRAFFAQDCPDFVPLVEQGITEGPAVERSVEAYLAPLRDAGVRTLILGCTHYPFLHSAITSFLKPGVRMVDPAESLADMVDAYLHAEPLRKEAAGSERGSRRFYCSGEPDRFQAVGSLMLGRPIEEVGRRKF
ncbi:MAG: glutamate racemase [Clostridiales bacterium]|nr:glutamate racemase [Clostridiales bacterium]